MAAPTHRPSLSVSSALDDLFPARGPQVDEDAVWIERELVEPNPMQPRKSFAPHALAELGRSLRADGQLQACVVRPHPERPGHFQIISGERRWRASGPGFADLTRLRCVVRQAGDAEAFRLALAENLHREDLSVVERARALVQIKESEPGFTWDKVAEQAQLSKRRILHLVELLKLPQEMVAHLESGAINEKHARALLSLQKQPEAQSQLLHDVLRDEISGNAALALASPRASARAGASTGAIQARQPAASSPPATPVNEAEIEMLELLRLLDPIVQSVERSIQQAGQKIDALTPGPSGSGDGEPGFTLGEGEPRFTMPDGTSALAPVAQARGQMRRIKSGIALLERALGLGDE